MKSQKILLSVALFSLGIVSCQKDERVITHFTAGIEQSLSKTHLDSDGMALKWDNNDAVMVYSNVATEGVEFTAIPRTGNDVADLTSETGIAAGTLYTAIHPVGIALSASSVMLPAVQQSSDGSLSNYPMYAQSENDVFHFENLCGALKIHLQQANCTISSIKVTVPNANIAGTYTVSNTDDGFALTNCTNGSSTTTLTLTASQSIDGDGHDFYIYLPEGEYSNMELSFYQPDGTCCTKHGNVDVVRSKYTPIAINGGLTFTIVHDNTEGRLTGLFSVSEGHQVYFSQGNLQWSATNGGSTFTTHDVITGGVDEGTWRFAENQYDYIGYTNNLVSATYNDWIDLFCWGTSGYHDENDIFNTKYRPYDCSGETNSSAPLNPTGYGPSTNKPSPNLTGSSSNYDWGVYNAISNGGNVPGLWRTLTRGEWEYLWYTRPASTINGTENARYVAIRIGDGISDVYSNFGILLFPDDFTWPLPNKYPSDINGSYGAAGDDPDGSGSNRYTYDEFRTLEEAGCVYLPAAGIRIPGARGMEIWLTGNHGHYWSSSSSSPIDSEASVNKYAAYSRTFMRTSDGLWSRSYGKSVRLVQDANN